MKIMLKICFCVVWFYCAVNSFVGMWTVIQSFLFWFNPQILPFLYVFGHYGFMLFILFVVFLFTFVFMVGGRVEIREPGNGAILARMRNITEKQISAMSRIDQFCTKSFFLTLESEKKGFSTRYCIRGVRNSAARCTRRQNLILILASISSTILASISKILASIFFFGLYDILGKSFK